MFAWPPRYRHARIRLEPHPPAATGRSKNESGGLRAGDRDGSLVPVGGMPGTIEFVEYQLASERSTLLKSDGLGLGRLGPRRMLSAPDGTCHAVPVGSSVAACGRAGLTLWARPWGSGSVQRCDRCLEIVPVPSVDGGSAP